MEPIELRDILVQKHALYQASLVCHLKRLFESGPDEMDISREIRRSRGSPAEWDGISNIEMKLGAFGNTGTIST